MIYPWPTLDPLLRALYADGPPPHGALAAFARAQGVPYARVKRRAELLRARGVALPNQYRPWTEADNAWLIWHYRQGVRACARHFGRSPKSITAQLGKLGLNLRTEYNLADLATALGCHPSTVERWRRVGYVQVAQRVRGVAGRNHYYPAEIELHRFLCEYRHLWTKFPCPGRAWLAGLLEDATLQARHGCAIMQVPASAAPF